MKVKRKSGQNNHLGYQLVWFLWFLEHFFPSKLSRENCSCFAFEYFYSVLWKISANLNSRNWLSRRRYLLSDHDRESYLFVDRKCRENPPFFRLLLSRVVCRHQRRSENHYEGGPQSDEKHRLLIFQSQFCPSIPSNFLEWSQIGWFTC